MLPNARIGKLNVLLMVPPREKQSVFLRTQYLPPIGLAYLVSYARKKAEEENIPIDFTILDSTIEGLVFDGLKKVLIDLRPNVIGLNFYTENRFDALKAIQIIKNHDPNIVIVAGGSHATLASDDTIRRFNGIDFIVRGEGEATFYELLKGLHGNWDFSQVAGISYKRNGQIHHNPDRPFIQDLDSVPFPAWDKLKMDRYYGSLDWYQTNEKMGMLFTSRGCPFHCNFCSSAQAWGNRYRMRSAGNIIEEIVQLKKKFGISAFIFFDDTMTIVRKRAMEICEQISGNGLDIRWQTHSRIDTMDAGLMDKMRLAGCAGIMFGVESGSQRIIDEVIKKRVKIEQAGEVSKLGKLSGMVNNFSYIVSHPTETMADAELTLEMIARHLEDKQTAVLNIMRTYPGTKVEEYAIKHNLLPKDFAWSREMEFESGIVSRTLKGNVPFFRDVLTWEQIFTVNSRYLKMIKYPIYKHAIDALKNIRSARDVADLARLGLVHIKTGLFSSK
ncbi:MAG: cobalamin B12-binding domain-containing protein [Nitrospinae bacterium]|nr:cobalamin B12-binding domain-containing protein [Nitrospinota bacterium]